MEQSAPTKFDLVDFYLGFSGRINRKQFWLYGVLPHHIRRGPGSNTDHARIWRLGILRSASHRVVRVLRGPHLAWPSYPDKALARSRQVRMVDIHSSYPTRRPHMDHRRIGILAGDAGGEPLRPGAIGSENRKRKFQPNPQQPRRHKNG